MSRSPKSSSWILWTVSQLLYNPPSCAAGGSIDTRFIGFDPIPPSTPLPQRDSTALDTLQMTPEKALEHLHAELDYEILEMKRVLKVGGIAVWRSAAKRPWYRQRFEAAGFKGE